MEFGILGPVQARDGGVRLELCGARGQKVLAALLLAPNRVVPLTNLVDVVWDGEPPSTGKHQIQKSVGDLRAALGAPGMIVTDGPGYRLVLGAAALDVVTFERHVSTAQAAEPAEAVRLLRTALSLWRGPALAGLNSQALRVEAERLDERRIAVAQQCFALQIELGQHEQVITELSALVATNPFREQLVEQLMIALYRSNRQADALELYDRTRRLLADELGIEPGRSLRSAHQAILNQHNESTPNSAKAPAQLPADLARFTGRQSWLDELDASLAAPTVAITCIAGTAGVGKTALAVHWAHRVRDRFPDGQLYLDLRGYADASATTPAEALTQFLRGLGVPPDQIPGEVSEQASAFRSILAHRRVLILLDNAANEDQVRPLLPGTPGSAVVVTSRNDLRGLFALDDARRVELGPLLADEAHALIGRVLGPVRADAEPEAVADLAALCGYLPLAIRIAAANLVCRPYDRIADAVADLARGNRLAQLAINGDRRAAVTAAFELSLKSLPEEAARLFRLLGLLPRTDFTAHTASVLMGVEDARGLVSVLESASLIEPHTRGRFRMHDLLHLYARDLVSADEDADKARLRLLDHYLHTTDAALDVLAPEMYRIDRDSAVSFGSNEDALSWLDGEGESVAVCAVRAVPMRYRWELADALRRWCCLRRHFDRWHETSSAGLAAAEEENDPRGRAAMHHSLGTLHRELDGRQGVAHLEAALGLYGEIGDQSGKFHCLNDLAVLHLALGRTQDASGLLRQALPLTDDPALAAVAHLNLGLVAARSGRLGEALEHCERAGELPDALLGFAIVGTTRHRLGQLDESAEALRRGLKLAESLGRLDKETECLVDLARVLHASGDESALELAERALAQATSSEFLMQRGRALATLSLLSLKAGEVERAHELAVEALAVQRETGFALGQAESLLALSRADDPESAAHMEEMRAIVARVTGVHGGEPAGVLCETDFD